MSDPAPRRPLYRGPAPLGLIFLIVALICAIVLALMGFDVISADNATGWLGLTLSFLIASMLF